MPDSTQHRIWGIIVFWVGIGLSCLALYLAMHDLPLRDIGNALLQVRWVYGGLVLLSVSVNITAKTARWRVLLGMIGIQRPFYQISLSLMAGQLWNQVSPVRLGDLSRAWLPGLGGQKKMFVLSTVAVEKLMDTFLYATLILVLIFMTPFPTWINFPVAFLAAAGAGVLGFTFFMLVQHRLQPEQILEKFSWLPSGLHKRILNALQAIIEAVSVFRSNLFPVLGLTVLIWLTALLNIYLAMLAMGISLSGLWEWTTSVVLLLAGLQAGISLPSAPMTVGVFEYICKSVLVLFGVNGVSAFAFGVFLHTITMLPLIVLGLIGAIYTWYTFSVSIPTGQNPSSNERDG